MAARSTPSGSVPERTVPDVKDTSVTASGLETSTQAASTKTQDSKSDDMELLSEQDLETLEGKKIPYTRFKEVNEKAKTYELQLKDSERRHQEDLRRAVEDAELRASQRFQKAREDESIMDQIDPTQREVSTLKNEIATLKGTLSQVLSKAEQSELSASIKQLEGKYPEANPVAVLAIAKHLKRTSMEDIEELMLDDHTRSVDKTQRQLREIIEQKKQKAKAAMPTREGGIKLKDTDRPKTIKEAGQKLRNFFSS